MVHERGQYLLQLQEKPFARFVAVGIHVKFSGERSVERGEKIDVVLREERGRGDGDGLMPCREHGPAVGTTFGNVERLTRMQQIQATRGIP